MQSSSGQGVLNVIQQHERACRLNESLIGSYNLPITKCPIERTDIQRLIKNISSSKYYFQSKGSHSKCSILDGRIYIH